MTDADDDFDNGDCWQCGGEGYVYGCSWDWQCDTYDEGEGSCLCFRRCDVCCTPTPDRSGEAAKTENTGLAGGESGLPKAVQNKSA